MRVSKLGVLGENATSARAAKQGRLRMGSTTLRHTERLRSSGFQIRVFDSCAAFCIAFAGGRIE